MSCIPINRGITAVDKVKSADKLYICIDFPHLLRLFCFIINSLNQGLVNLGTDIYVSGLLYFLLDKSVQLLNYGVNLIPKPHNIS